MQFDAITQLRLFLVFGLKLLQLTLSMGGIFKVSLDLPIRSRVWTRLPCLFFIHLVTKFDLNIIFISVIKDYICLAFLSSLISRKNEKQIGSHRGTHEPYSQ